MPNPTINPAWGVDLAYTVTDSDYLAVDVRLSGLAVEPAQIEVIAPAGAELGAVRDPTSWAATGEEVLGGGGWAPGAVALGNWSLTVLSGAAVTDPAIIEVSNPDGLSADGLLRLVFRTLGGGALEVGPAGGNLSIDRLLGDPTIINPQVTSGLPVRELDDVTLGATTQATVTVNPAPSVPLPPLPTLLSQWEPEPDNPLAVTGFTSTGATADFKAPAAYEEASLGFRLTAAYDLAGSSTIDSGDPRNEEVLALDVQTVTHGMVLVLDRSGSMGGTLGGGISKWDGTVQAAHAWLDLFRSFRTGGGHKAGIVTFEHDGCSWTLSPPGNVTLRNPQNGAAASDMETLADLGDHPVLDLGPRRTCTPIGDALVEGLKAIQTALEPGNVATMLLLTDGYENAGRVTIKSVAGPAATTFQAERVTPSLSFGNDLVGDRLFTLGVGSSVDEDRLNDLAGPAGYYRMTTDVKEILPTFAEMLGEVLDAEELVPTSLSDPSSPAHAVYFEVPTGEQRIALLVPWTSATHNLRVAWRLQGASEFTVVDPGDPAVIGYWRRQFHGLMTVDLVALTGNGSSPATDWRVQHMDAGNDPQPLTDADVLGMRDLVTKAEIRFDKRQYFIGEPIHLTCRIRSGGRRVTGATVGVDVAGPGEGLGTFLATNAPLFKGQADASLTHAGTATRDASEAARVDPDQGKGLMFKTLLALKQMDTLPVVTPPQFQLFDDGAHGDGAADDGDYANQFTATDKEGTYTFRFRVEGTLEDGSRFSRLLVRSTWVGVKPDPASTTMLWTVLDDVPAGQLGHLLTFTPRAANGELLGPFRNDVIEVSVSDGAADGPLVDNLDGSYSQRVLYRPTQDPIVAVDVYGVPMRPTGPTIGREEASCMRLWIRAIVCTFRKLLQLLFGGRSGS